MQLVELQRTIHASHRDEVAVVAISYDPVAVLADFASERGITFPLLADVGSVALGELGLINTQLVEERAFWGRTLDEKHRGMPYPGTFLLDESGVLIDKVFERSHRIRAGGGVLLERLGLDSTDAEGAVTSALPAVDIAAWVDRTDYFPNQLNRVHVRLAVEDGYHIYVPPNPTGFRNLDVTVSGPDGLFCYPVAFPDGHEFSVEGFDEQFSVVEGQVDITVPFYLLEDLVEPSLSISVSLQACSAETCLVPETVEMVIGLTEIRA